jgi:hypothetical protein
MPNDLHAILLAFECIPKRLFDVVSGYIFFLTLHIKKHTFRAAADVVGLDETRFSAFFNGAEAKELGRLVLNRAARRRLAKAKRIDGRLVFIVDSTILGRRGKRVENARRYHHGGGFANGHKFVNFVVLTPAGVIPVDSVPVYTKKYCRENRLKYRTENDIVRDWLEALRTSDIFSKHKLKRALFLLDSGFDARPVQRAIRSLGADFVMALKSSRAINGKQVREYFRTHRRWLPWTSIRLDIGSGKNKKRRKYSIRTAAEVTLKGVGPVTAVCSKARSRARKPTKYLAASDLSMTGRQIVAWYTRRWRIETWHREMKQNYGLIDCRCSRFSAVESHVSLCLVAYLLAKEKTTRQRTIGEFTRLRELKHMARELTRFGGARRVKSLVDAATQAIAA